MLYSHVSTPLNNLETLDRNGIFTKTKIDIILHIKLFKVLLVQPLNCEWKILLRFKQNNKNLGAISQVHVVVYI